MYKKLIRPILFKIDPETVHNITFWLIKFLHYLPGFGLIMRSYYEINNPKLNREVFGLKFKNPIGLAAGFDKDAKLFNELSNFGFGFIEIGTVTPKPQIGNSRKRLFRLKEDSGLINRMGFNNEGVDNAINKLKRNRKILIGGNIGKNSSTANNKAINDYLYCFEKLFPYVDYFVINVSSPNTPNLRDLQLKIPLTTILNKLQLFNNQKQKRKPILIKISPDLNKNQLIDIIEIVKTTKIDGIIATNTTLDRNGLKSSKKNQSGGLSGIPLKNKSTEIIKFLSKKSNKDFPIIGVGGVHSFEDAIEKINAGADLIQLYTGFIYEGPSIVKKINESLIKKLS
ncbi:MAG: dihydroorotate dehydrogenase (quinone) [Flavobacteriaceae bacterium]|nr:dihydroorotate dehydrogenase (quinone) [Flavobacteriaceae bacterium]|tara:strand:- start:7359 stop:8381 length:1023 start_codon:yes stop_codon:yes gene_type:complete